MRTASVIIFADVLWQDGVEVPEHVMRDLCPHLAMHIAEFLQDHEEEYPDLIKGKVRVQWGAPTTPENLAAELRREELERMTTATPDAPELTEEQAPPTDTPPAKSWAAYTYPIGQAANEQCHIYGYDTSGNPLTEEAATELGAKLTDATTGVMVLPVENEPPLAGASAEEREAGA